MSANNQAETSVARLNHSAPIQGLHVVQNGSPSMTETPHTPLRAWLSLGFTEDGGTTRLVDRDHYGPLLVQKPLYPEGREVCHTVIIHPPGGVVGGDQLELRADVRTGARVQITTPGAAKWYKANGHVSHQNIRLNVGAGGSLEWVPQETIFYDNADLVLDHEVRLEKDASYVGCEILCFGRTASGESFSSGRVRQRNRIYRDGKLIWVEQIRLLGGSSAMHNPLALAGKTVCATLIVTGKTIPRELIETAREGAERIAGDASCVGVSQLKSAVVARYLGDSSETARHVMLHVWGLFRPVMLGRPAIVPRMWNT